MRKVILYNILLFVIILLHNSCDRFASRGISTESFSEETVIPLASEDLIAQASEELPIPTSTREIYSPVLERPDMILIYTKAGDIWMWRMNEKRQLTSSGDAYSPRISPDGQAIAFIRPADEIHQELWAINMDGTNLRRLVSFNDLDVIGGGVIDPNAVGVIPYHYKWVPGTHTLAFNTQQIFQGPGLSLLDDLNLVDADNPVVKPLLLSGWGGDFVYSPDGRWIAISTSDSIILCRSDGSNYRKILTYEPVNTYSEYRYYASPIWSSDGTILQVAIPPKDSLENPHQPTNLWEIPIDGSPPSKAGEVTAVPFFEEPVVFSPDLAHLAYLKETGLPVENRREVHIASSDGSGDLVYATHALLHFLSWSVDSNRISFSVGEDQEAWIGALVGTPAVITPDPKGIMDLRWLDSRNFLYIQQKTDRFELVLADIDGGMLLLDSIPVGKGVLSLLPYFDFTYP